MIGTIFFLSFASNLFAHTLMTSDGYCVKVPIADFLSYADLTQDSTLCMTDFELSPGSDGLVVHSTSSGEFVCPSQPLNGKTSFCSWVTSVKLMGVVFETATGFLVPQDTTITDQCLQRQTASTKLAMTLKTEGSNVYSGCIKFSLGPSPSSLSKTVDFNPCIKLAHPTSDASVESWEAAFSNGGRGYVAGIECSNCLNSTQLKNSLFSWIQTTDSRNQLNALFQSKVNSVSGSQFVKAKDASWKAVETIGNGREPSAFHGVAHCHNCYNLMKKDAGFTSTC